MKKEKKKIVVSFPHSLILHYPHNSWINKTLAETNY